MSGYTDLHSHLLPGIDDGSRSVEQSVAVLEAMAAGGVETLALTPHVTASEIADHPDDVVEQRDETFAILKPEAPEKPRLVLGFEIMLDEPLSAKSLADRRFSVAGSRYFLVEFPINVSPVRFRDALKEYEENGVVPLVAHPERYFRLSIPDLANIRRRGARLQIDAIDVTRRNPRSRRARELVKAGLADVIASDNHGDAKIVSAAVRYLEEHGHKDVAHVLAMENPCAVVEDREMVAVRPAKIKIGWGAGFRKAIDRVKAEKRKGESPPAA